MRHFRMINGLHLAWRFLWTRIARLLILLGHEQCIHFEAVGWRVKACLVMYRLARCGQILVKVVELVKAQST